LRDSEPPLTVVIGIDVEEEGLFSGKYPRTPQGVENVNELRRLEFIASEFGLPLTLLVSHSVAVSPACLQVLDFFRVNHRAEIGAHLHPWNTPPFQDLPHAEPVRSDLIPRPLLGAKFETLITSLRNNLGVFPQSFRMGRFDLGKQVCQLLPEFGFIVDSSVVPLRNIAGGPDHFLAQADPFPLNMQDVHRENARVLEVPLTVVPLLHNAPHMAARLASRLSERGRNAVFSGFRHMATAGIHPAWFPLPSMKLAVRLHRARGGKVLNMFLHSSELKPGATPSFRTGTAVDALVQKIRRFLTWLVRTEPVKGATFSELYGQDWLFARKNNGSPVWRV
jgi:hypothetical protein